MKWTLAYPKSPLSINCCNADVHELLENSTFQCIGIYVEADRDFKSAQGVVLHFEQPLNFWDAIALTEVFGADEYFNPQTYPENFEGLPKTGMLIGMWWD